MIGSWRRSRVSYKFFTDQDDLLLVKEAKNGCFSMRLFYRLLDLSPAVLFPFQSIWNPFVPINVVFFFAWQAFRARF